MLAVIGAAYLFAFFDIVNIGAALPKIADQFGISSGRASLAISVGLAGYVIGALADSWISDRIGRREALLVSVAFFSVGTLISALATDFTLLAIGRLIAGMGIGAEIAAAAAYLAGISPAHLRGRVGSIAVAWGFLGLAIVPFVTPSTRTVIPAAAPVRDRAVPPYGEWGLRRPRHPGAVHHRRGSRLA